MRLGKPVIEPITWTFNGHFVQYEELQGPHKSVFNFRYLNLYEQPNSDTRQGGYGHIEDFLRGVPASGLYDIEVEAQALHRDTHYDPKIFGIDFSEPFTLGIVPGDITKGHIHYPQAIEPLLASALVPDESPARIPFRVWLEAGQTPRFIFPNGPYESRASVLKVNKEYKDEFEEKVDKGVSRAILLREGKIEAALAALREAVEREDKLRYAEPPAWAQPVRHALGAALLQRARLAEAEDVYREDLARTPDNGWSLFGLAQALRLQNKNPAEAADLEARFKRVWAKADVTLTSSCFCLPGT
jgi:tetratricopeptide (TPR) repeat protein